MNESMNELNFVAQHPNKDLSFGWKIVTNSSYLFELKTLHRRKSKSYFLCTCCFNAFIEALIIKIWKKKSEKTYNTVSTNEHEKLHMWFAQRTGGHYLNFQDP